MDGIFLLSGPSDTPPMNERTAGMMKIAPIREKATEIRVVTPKVLMMGTSQGTRPRKRKRWRGPKP